MDAFLTQYFPATSRRWIVTTLTSVAALVLILPAADEYRALSVYSANLTEELAESRQTAVDLPEIERTAARHHADLAVLEALTIGEDSLHLFRGRIVELARGAGCHIRQVRVSPPRKRRWRLRDDPLDWDAVQNGSEETPYELSLVELSLALSGQQGQIQQFLEKLAALKITGHIRQVKAAATEAPEPETLLDVELWLFDLSRVPAAS